MGPALLGAVVLTGDAGTQGLVPSLHEVVLHPPKRDPRPNPAPAAGPGPRNPHRQRRHRRAPQRPPHRPITRLPRHRPTTRTTTQEQVKPKPTSVGPGYADVLRHHIGAGCRNRTDDLFITSGFRRLHTGPLTCGNADRESAYDPPDRKATATGLHRGAAFGRSGDVRRRCRRARLWPFDLGEHPASLGLHDQAVAPHADPVKPLRRPELRLGGTGRLDRGHDACARAGG